MAISSVIALSTAASIDQQRRAERRAKKAQRKMDEEVKAQKAADKAAEEKQKKLEAAAKPFGGTGAQARIGAERMALRRSRRGGRMSTIKSNRTSLG